MPRRHSTRALALSLAVLLPVLLAACVLPGRSARRPATRASVTLSAVPAGTLVEVQDISGRAFATGDGSAPLALMADARRELYVVLLTASAAGPTFLAVSPAFHAGESAELDVRTRGGELVATARVAP